MKNVLFILFLLGFCINQLHIIEPIAGHFYKCYSKEDMDANDDTAEGEEDESEKEGLEKEMKCFIVVNYAGHLNSILDVEYNTTIRYISLMYLNPSTQRDIKPPRFA